MDESLFRKIVDDGQPHLRYISLDGPGETIMNAEAFRMIGYAKSKGTRVMLSTNAAALDERTGEAVIDCGLDLIIFSINGVTPEVYQKVHGAPCYETVVANVRRFLKVKSSRNARILVVVQMVRLPETLPQVGAFYRLWRRVRGVDFIRVKKDVVRNETIWREAEPGSPFENLCPRLWQGPPYIETNGDVYACAGVMFKTGPVGNVAKDSLSEIWNGEQMRALRLAHIKGDLSDHPECLSCCYPKPRLALILSGFLVDPFVAGKLVPLAERLAFWRGLPLYETSSAKE